MSINSLYDEDISMSFSKHILHDIVKVGYANLDQFKSLNTLAVNLCCV